MRFTALVIAAFVFSLPSWVRTEAAQVRSAEDIAKDLKPNGRQQSSKEVNMTLSERRAQTVAEFLESKFGISRNRVEPVGMGSDHPLVPTADQIAEPRNRRVQVINLGGA